VPSLRRSSDGDETPPDVTAGPPPRQCADNNRWWWARVHLGRILSVFTSTYTWPRLLGDGYGCRPDEKREGDVERQIRGSRRVRFDRGTGISGATLNLETPQIEAAPNLR
jgi:hypothetical protein